MQAKTQNIKEPYPGIFVGAGALFGRSDFLADCPFDPKYKFLFSGEELLLSSCLFTYGWDIYNPSVSVFFHKYKSQGDIIAPVKNF